MSDDTEYIGRFPPPEQPVMIVADSYELARYWARENGLGNERRGWLFVPDIQGTHGRYGPGSVVRLASPMASASVRDRRQVTYEVLLRNGFAPFVGKLA